MSKYAFKVLSEEVDKRLSSDKEIEPEVILEGKSDIYKEEKKEIYREFIQDYREISENHLNQIEELEERKEELENKVPSKYGFRVISTTFSYSMLGMLYGGEPEASIFAVSGATLSSFDEITFKGMDLSGIAKKAGAGGLTGFILGKIFDPPNSVSWAYVGTILTGVPAIYKEYKKAEREAREFEEISEILNEKRESHSSKKEKLIQEKIESS